MVQCSASKIFATHAHGPVNVKYLSLALCKRASLRGGANVSGDAGGSDFQGNNRKRFIPRDPRAAKLLERCQLVPSVNHDLLLNYLSLKLAHPQIRKVQCSAIVAD
jgi:hypothetical protein